MVSSSIVGPGSPLHDVEVGVNRNRGSAVHYARSTASFLNARAEPNIPVLSTAVATCEGHGHGCPTAKVIREVRTAPQEIGLHLHVDSGSETPDAVRAGH